MAFDVHTTCAAKDRRRVAPINGRRRRVCTSAAREDGMDIEKGSAALWYITRDLPLRMKAEDHVSLHVTSFTSEPAGAHSERRLLSTAVCSKLAFVPGHSLYGSVPSVKTRWLLDPTSLHPNSTSAAIQVHFNTFVYRMRGCGWRFQAAHSEPKGGVWGVGCGVWGVGIV